MASPVQRRQNTIELILKSPSKLYANDQYGEWKSREGWAKTLSEIQIQLEPVHLLDYNEADLKWVLKDLNGGRLPVLIQAARRSAEIGATDVCHRFITLILGLDDETIAEDSVKIRNVLKHLVDTVDFTDERIRKIDRLVRRANQACGVNF